MGIIKKIKKKLIKGKEYATEAAYYLDKKAEKANRFIDEKTAKAEKKMQESGSMLNEKFRQSQIAYQKFKENTAKELKPLRQYAQNTQANLLYSFGNKVIRIVMRRKDGSVVINNFTTPVEAVKYIRAAKKLGHTLLKISK